ARPNRTGERQRRRALPRRKRRAFRLRPTRRHACRRCRRRCRGRGRWRPPNKKKRTTRTRTIFVGPRMVSRASLRSDLAGTQKRISAPQESSEFKISGGNFQERKCPKNDAESIKSPNWQKYR